MMFLFLSTEAAGVVNEAQQVHNSDSEISGHRCSWLSDAVDGDGELMSMTYRYHQLCTFYHSNYVIVYKSLCDIELGAVVIIK